MTPRAVWLLLLVALAGLSLPATAAEPGRMVLTTGMREPWTKADHTGFTDLVVREAFRRLGIEAEVSVIFARARGLRLADDGVDDGLTAAVAGLDKEYPNLIRVPEKIFDNDFISAALAGNEAAKSWPIAAFADLAPYSVAYIIGWQVFDHGLGPVRELTQVKDADQLFTLLGNGRAELILHERWQALWLAKQRGISLRVYEPPLAAVPMYTYLHKKHSDLVPRLAAVLAEMKRDGTYQTLADQAFGDLGHKANLLR
jgi:polar amino acid transport system substrate-binding protein